MYLTIQGKHLNYGDVMFLYNHFSNHFVTTSNLKQAKSNIILFILLGRHSGELGIMLFTLINGNTAK